MALSRLLGISTNPNDFGMRMRYVQTGVALAAATTFLLYALNASAETAKLGAGTNLSHLAAPHAHRVEPDPATRRATWVLTGSPDVRSSSVVIFAQDEDSILYAQDAERVMPIASITKLMTALVVRDAEQPLDELIKITSADVDTERGTTSRLRIGTELTREDLLHLALMSSENRAAHALGRSYPGGLTQFVRAMNSKADALGMSSARFVEPTGLSSGNVSSAADLVKLVLAASGDPIIRQYSTNGSHTVTVGRHLLEFRNSNLLVSKDDWQIALQKTGFTSDAGRCLVMTALVQDRPVVMILLNSFGTLTRVADARRVRRWMEASTPPPQFAQSGNEPLGAAVSAP